MNLREITLSWITDQYYKDTSYHTITPKSLFAIKTIAKTWANRGPPASPQIAHLHWTASGALWQQQTCHQTRWQLCAHSRNSRQNSQRASSLQCRWYASPPAETLGTSSSYKAPWRGGSSSSQQQVGRSSSSCPPSWSDHAQFRSQSWLSACLPWPFWESLQLRSGCVHQGRTTGRRKEMNTIFIMLVTFSDFGSNAQNLHNANSWI